MGETTKISWCDATFNPWIGCAKVSAGCKHCYAEQGTSARVSASRGLPLWGPGSSRQITSDANWKQPVRWNREAAASGVRRRVFCASLCDVFEDRPDLREPRSKLVSLINQTPFLDWLLLTKRPENMVRLAAAAGWPAAWPDHVWAGTTCEDQAHADERIPHLLAVHAAVRFVSYEPALELVDFSRWLVEAPDRNWPDCRCDGEDEPCEVCDERGPRTALDWIIVGGESGPKARPFDPRWAMSTIAQCESAGVACFVKQLGSRPGAHLHTELGRGMHVDDGIERFVVRDPKGGDWDEWPKHLRVREWPRGAMR